MDFAVLPPGPEPASPDSVGSDAAAPTCAPEFPSVDEVSAALTAPQNLTVRVIAEHPADDTLVSRLRSGNKRTFKEMEFICVCDHTVTAAQKADGSAIECSKAGCEPIWVFIVSFRPYTMLTFHSIIWSVSDRRRRERAGFASHAEAGNGGVN
ncbi:hypothetical protein B0H17DRAFT_1131847 [Mycena rosella]|uniref:Uncharacterized protein n=1 Tax=Mycena rosella TaxID=1033263 RepID=A0AAD7GK17_MYCRO|nr:hypothetical protein B0H17DRAFT_1131847 [Mycena rosella]